MLQVATTAGYSLQAEPLLDGDAGTAQTIERIRVLVDEGRRQPLVNQTAGGILRAAGVPPYAEELAEIRAIFAWLLNPKNVRFTRDPDGAETLRPASTILEWGFGDCDDINAILLPSLLATVGVPRANMRLVTIASHPGAPRVFSHIYLEVLTGGRWIPLDAARRDTRFGVEPARQYRKRVWSLVADEYQDLKGLGDCGCRCAPAGLGSQMRLGRELPRRRGLGSQMRLGRELPSHLGQFDWSAFSNVVTGISTAAATAIRAANQPKLVLPSASSYPVPDGYAGPSASGSVQFAGISGTTLLLGGVVLLAILMRNR